MKSRLKLSPARKITISFLLVIIFGAILLYLPFTHAGRQNVSFLDALFIATSATCVTGLSSVTIATTFNTIGHLIILFLIQIGGLGFITIMAGFILLLKNRITLTQQIALRDFLNRKGLFNINSFLKEILMITFTVEAVGAICLSFALIPQMGWQKGLWQSVFLSISAFCNAGFDILGSSSLFDYRNNWLICLVIMLLIIIGGIGFAVWYDIKEYFHALSNLPRNYQKSKFSLAAMKLTTHTKLVLSTTAILIIIPAIVIFYQEAGNPATLGPAGFAQKILQALFQSVTLRTAGFSTTDIGGLHTATKFIFMPLMFIGGSPGGTAGGIKTTTIALIFYFLYATLRNKARVSIFKRDIDNSVLHKCAVIVISSFTFLISGVYLLTLSEVNLSFLDILFESISALATVGLSTGITTALSATGKFIIIILMFAGRIGIVTLIFSLVNPEKTVNKVAYPTGHIIVG